MKQTAATSYGGDIPPAFFGAERAVDTSSGILYTQSENQSMGRFGHSRLFKTSLSASSICLICNMQHTHTHTLTTFCAVE